MQHWDEDTQKIAMGQTTHKAILQNLGQNGVMAVQRVGTNQSMTMLSTIGLIAKDIKDDRMPHQLTGYRAADRADVAAGSVS